MKDRFVNSLCSVNESVGARANVLSLRLLVVLVGFAVTLFTGCSPGRPDDNSNPMQHQPDYFTAKWGPPIAMGYTDEWGNTTPKESAKGAAIKWKVNNTLTVQVLAVGGIVHIIQYTGQPGASYFWTKDQISNALEANGHRWKDPNLNLISAMIGDMLPRSYISAEGNWADYSPTTHQLTIKTPARLQAEQAKQAADEAAKAAADKNIRF